MLQSLLLLPAFASDFSRFYSRRAALTESAHLKCTCADSIVAATTMSLRPFLQIAELAQSWGSQLDTADVGNISVGCRT